jgi:hypothetical protein
MVIRKVREITTIKFLSVIDNENDAEYIGESFEAVIENQSITGFIDWLNGNSIDGFIINPAEIGTYKIYTGWDIEGFDNSIASTNRESVAQWLKQKLLIQYGELNYYMEDTSDVGVPYIDKKSKEELDLIIRSEILNTPGVIDIMSFTSRVENRVYVLNFSVKTTEGEIVWLSIEA